MVANKDPEWFDQLAPALLRNRTIRSFLAQYASRDWPEATKLTLLYGIIALGKAHPGQAPLPLDQLKSILLSGHVALTVESAIPDVKQQLVQLQAQLDEVTDDVYQPLGKPMHPGAFAPGALGPPQQQPGGHTVLQVPAVVHGNARSPERGRRRAASPAAARRGRSSSLERQQRQPQHFALPSADWRSDDSRTWSPPGRKRSPVREDQAPRAAVYPAWWGDGSQGKAAAAAAAGLHHMWLADKPPPRLGYSMQEPKVPVYKDDLVTAQYLDVPGSGYGQQQQQQQQHSGSPAWFQQQAPGPLYPADMQQQQQQQQLFVLHPSGVLMPLPHTAAGVQQGWGQGGAPGAESGEAPGAGGRARRDPRKAESKIRVQVRQDKAAARQRAAAEVLRRSSPLSLAAAAAAPSPAARPRPGSAASPPSAASTPSQVAANLTSNPWTLQFLAEGQEGGGEATLRPPQAPASGGNTKAWPEPAAAASSPWFLPDQAGAAGPPGPWLLPETPGPTLAPASGRPGPGGGPEAGGGRPRAVGWVVPAHDSPEQRRQQQQERQQQQGPRRVSAGGEARAPPPGVRPEVLKYARGWVGDFGHLAEEPRFAPQKAFQHHLPAAEGRGPPAAGAAWAAEEAVSRPWGSGGGQRQGEEQGAGGDSSATSSASRQQQQLQQQWASRQVELSFGGELPSLGEGFAEEAWGNAAVVAAAAAVGAAAATTAARDQQQQLRDDPSDQLEFRPPSGVRRNSSSGGGDVASASAQLPTRFLPASSRPTAIDITFPSHLDAAAPTPTFSSSSSLPRSSPAHISPTPGQLPAHPTPATPASSLPSPTTTSWSTPYTTGLTSPGTATTPAITPATSLAYSMRPTPAGTQLQSQAYSTPGSAAAPTPSSTLLTPGSTLLTPGSTFLTPGTPMTGYSGALTSLPSSSAPSPTPGPMEAARQVPATSLYLGRPGSAGSSGSPASATWPRQLGDQQGTVQLHVTMQPHAPQLPSRASAGSEGGGGGGHQSTSLYRQMLQRELLASASFAGTDASGAVSSTVSLDSSSASSVATEDVLRLNISTGGGYEYSDASSQSSKQ